MSLEEYRRLVRQVYCPFESCQATPGQPCRIPLHDDVTWDLEYVHDNRSAAYHEETALPVLSATYDDENPAARTTTYPAGRDASEALQEAYNLPPLDLMRFRGKLLHKWEYLHVGLFVCSLVMMTFGIGVIFMSTPNFWSIPIMAIGFFGGLILGLCVLMNLWVPAFFTGTDAYKNRRGQ